jgi:transposase-like protein
MGSKVKKTEAIKSLGQLKHFSDVVKKQTVQDIEQGKCTVLEASRELSVSVNSIYQWVYKYSGYLQKGKILMVEDQSEAYKTKALEKKLQEAEAALGRKQMEVDFLNKLIELAGADLKMDLKKNFSNHASNGTGTARG